MRRHLPVLSAIQQSQVRVGCADVVKQKALQSPLHAVCAVRTLASAYLHSVEVCKAALAQVCPVAC
jgi:hypothetical protein